jgi:predicted MFS family arabinose efflux permease
MDSPTHSRQGSAKFVDWIVILLLGSAFFAAVSVNYVISPVLPAIARHFEITVSRAGILVSVYSLTYAISALLFGPLSDQLGRKRMMYTALLLFAVMTFLCGVVQEFVWLALFRALAGVAAAMLQPATWGYLGDYFAYEKRGTAAAWVMQAGSIAVILGIPLGGLIAFYLDWHGIFLVASVLAVVIAVLVIVLLPSLNPEEKVDFRQLALALFPAMRSTFRALASSKIIRSALLVSFLIWFGFQGFYTYVGAFLDEQFGLDTARISFVTLTLGVGYILGGQAGGRLSDRLGRKAVVLSGLGFLAMVLAILPRLDDLPWVILGIFAMGFGFFFTYSAQVTLMTEVFPAARSTTMAVNYFFTYIGLMAGSAMGGLILIRSDFSWLGVMAASACVLAGIVAYRIVFAERT